MPHVLVLMQDAPTPPVEVRVAAPSIDLSGIGQAIVNAFQGSMPQLATSAAQASVPAIQSTAPVLATSAGQSIATGGGGLVDTLGQNPLNVLTSTLWQCRLPSAGSFDSKPRPRRSPHQLPRRTCSRRPRAWTSNTSTAH